MRLKYLEIEGFRSFRDRTRIDFPESGLVLIKGESGSGKTNLFLAILYAVGVCPIPATKLKSWETDSFQVELGLEVDGQDLTICRGKNNSIAKSGIVTVSGAKAVGEELVRIFGDPEVLAASVYRGQKTAGTFLSKSDAEKRTFLTQLIPSLSKIEDYIAEQEVLLKTATQEEAVAKAVLDEAQARLDAIAPPEVKELDTVEQDKSRLLLEIEALKEKAAADSGLLKTKLNEADLKLATLRQQAESTESAIATSKEAVKMATEIQTLKKERDVIQEENTRKYQEFRQSQKVAEENVAKLSKVVWSCQTELEKKSRLLKELEQIRTSTCPTCDQPWLAGREKKEPEIVESLQKIAKIELNLPAIESALQAAKASQPSWSDNPKLAQTAEDLARRQSELSSFLTSQKKVALADLNSEIRSTQDAKNAVQQALMTIQQSMQQSVQSKQQEIASLERAVNMATALVKNRQSAEARVVEQKAKHQELAKRKDLLTEVVACLGRSGFFGNVFDQILAEIESETNSVLATLQNVAGVCLKFTTEQSNSKGAVKKVIVPTLTVNGHEADYQSGISGGQQSSVELATDMALLAVAERRMGRSLGWLLQDEVLIGQGVETSSNAMELLKKIAQTKLVLVIDHASEVKEFFAQCIEVKNANGVSSV